MKKVAMVLVLCGLASAAMAQEAAQEWTTTVDLSYTCKYIWRGFDILDNAGAFQPSVDFKHQSGLGANLWMSFPERGGWTDDLMFSRADLTEYDYTFYYDGTALTDNCWETNYRLGWRYYDRPGMASENADMQEVFVEAAMPKLTGTPMTPHVAVYQMWPAQGGGAVSGAAGTIYVAGFSYGWTFEQAPELPMTFSWDIVYNDGTGVDVDSDLSHMLWGLKTEMECPMTGAKIIPAVYFQNSFESSVNSSDEFWGGLSYRLAF